MYTIMSNDVMLMYNVFSFGGLCVRAVRGLDELCNVHQVTLSHFRKHTSLSLSQCFPLIYGDDFLRLWSFFYHFWSRSPHIPQQAQFSREHIFVGFKNFPSLVCCCTDIHHHRPQGPTLYRRMG